MSKKNLKKRNAQILQKNSRKSVMEKIEKESESFNRKSCRSVKTFDITEGKRKADRAKYASGKVHFSKNPNKNKGLYEHTYNRTIYIPPERKG